MGRFSKILLFILSILSIAISISILSLFYPIPFISDALKNSQDFYPWLNIVFSGFCVLIALFCALLILIIILSPGKSDDLALIKNKGKLLFSKQTIESTVMYCFADVSGINYSKVMVKLNKNPEKTKIYVKLSLNDSERLVELTQTVQEKIESTLISSLGIVVEHINIKVIEFNTHYKPEKQKSADEDAKSRVI